MPSGEIAEVESGPPISGWSRCIVTAPVGQEEGADRENHVVRPPSGQRSRRSARAAGQPQGPPPLQLPGRYRRDRVFRLAQLAAYPQQEHGGEEGQAKFAMEPPNTT